MNEYNVRCPGCAHDYVDLIIGGFLKLLHKNYRYGDPPESLPTPRCIGVIDYVKFQECQHCCPESFADCPKCSQGKPTKQFCTR